jgi:hypothetical protein
MWSRLLLAQETTHLRRSWCTHGVGGGFCDVCAVVSTFWTIA